MSLRGRTELMRCVSRTKNCEEFDGEVRLAVEPSNLGEKIEKRSAERKQIENDLFLTSKNEMLGIV